MTPVGSVCVYTASRDVFLMAKPVASFPLKSLLLQSCSFPMEGNTWGALAAHP